MAVLSHKRNNPSGFSIFEYILGWKLTLLNSELPWKKWYMEFSVWFLLESCSDLAWMTQWRTALHMKGFVFNQPANISSCKCSLNFLILSVLKIVSLVIEKFLQLSSLICSFSSLGLRSEMCAALWPHLAEKHWLSIIFCKLDVLFGI